ncbi:uncharacterized protein MYCFIDRAFT_184656 [Pseudocercospora fijiensis CIRAD86]|uniref:Lytic polysaccharide monooxygenase n=1 Tax=Pseudocercospora fijiensis (strain CIRAD86) TaxID=383855 RepID=N1Q7S7_PSEFD|nr:uncharacterized protein MYCFIDRAFT_184656 [Pseudocercospora fijiensis CIRAD86]EME87736.1 hypothetical protein MYCFIDRAFT_184656 [Pseudocercospora fijiensis CIRAD86]
MFSKTSTLALAALALCGTSTAHMIMVQPKPFNAKTINNSPLVGVKPGSATSDFPCKVGKAGPKYDDASVSMNHMKVGDTQKLIFEGSASHGGGTCLLSISLDQYPDENSVWKIIQTYEGGCPTAADGNDGASNFTFSIPKEIPNGPSTLSWTWYNKTYNTLPNAYFINLPPEECSSVEGTDLEIPHPGKYMTALQNTLKAATGPSCQASAAAQTKSVSGGAPGYGGTSGSASAPAPSSVQPTSAAGYGGTSATSGSAPAYNSAPSSSVGAPAYSSAASPSMQAPESSAASPSMQAPESSAASPSMQAPESSAFPQTTPAAGEGVYGPVTTSSSAAVPIGTGSSSSSSGILCKAAHAGEYGQAVNGKTVWRALAAGTTCPEVQQYRKRSDMRHAHVRRHVQNAVLRHAA